MQLMLVNKKGRYHYSYIKYFNRFTYNETNHHNKKKHFCMSRLQWLNNKEILTNHLKVWLEINEKQAIKMPKKYSNVQLIITYCTDYNKQLHTPFVIYVDFKSYLEKVKKWKR